MVYMTLGSVHISIANKVLNVCIFICAYQIISKTLAVYPFNGLQLAKLKKYIPPMSLR